MHDLSVRFIALCISSRRLKSPPTRLAFNLDPLPPGEPRNPDRCQLSESVAYLKGGKIGSAPPSHSMVIRKFSKLHSLDSGRGIRSTENSTGPAASRRHAVLSPKRKRPAWGSESSQTGGVCQAEGFGQPRVALSGSESTGAAGSGALPRVPGLRWAIGANSNCRFAPRGPLTASRDGRGNPARGGRKAGRCHPQRQRGSRAALFDGMGLGGRSEWAHPIHPPSVTRILRKMSSGRLTSGP